MEITLKDYIDTYYEPDFIRTTKSEKSRKSDLIRLSIIKKDIEFSSKLLTEINYNNLHIFFNKIKKERKLKNGTVNQYIRRMKAVLNHAKYAGIIQFNPVSQIKQYKSEFRTRVLEAYEVLDFFNECAASRNKELIIIVLTAVYTGMRFGEIIKLTPHSIINGFVHLEGSETKSGYARKIPLHPHLKAILKTRVYHSADCVFKSKDVRGAFNNACKRAKIHNFRFHDLRRTFGTYLKDNDVHIHTISKILGHCNASMTEIYLASSHKKMADAIGTLSFICCNENNVTEPSSMKELEIELKELEKSMKKQKTA